MFKNLSRLFRFGLLLVALLLVAILVMLPRACRAQVPFPKPLCPEAVEWKGRYERAKAILDSTRAVGNRLLTTKADRIKSVVATGNKKLKEGAEREDDLKTVNGQYKIGLRLLASELRKEAERPRLFGIGRKRAVRRFEEVVNQLLDY